MYKPCKSWVYLSYQLVVAWTINSSILPEKKNTSKNHLKKFFGINLFSPLPKGGIPSHHPTKLGGNRPGSPPLQAMDASDLALALALASDLPHLGVCKAVKVHQPTDRWRDGSGTINKPPFRNKNKQKTRTNVERKYMRYMRYGIYIIFLWLGLRMFREETRKTRRKL